MTRIERADWKIGVFGRARRFCDLLREPLDGYEMLPMAARKPYRQTQIFEGEAVRILGRSGTHLLVMKFEGTLGWVQDAWVAEEPGLRDFEPFPREPRSAREFLEQWKGTPYLWGGWSRAGVDCSGLTQWYFLEVHGRVIPKNSRDQRKIGTPKRLEAVSDHDLIFCHRKGAGIHHVGIYYDRSVWHARIAGGVVQQNLDDFIQECEIEAVADLLKDCR